MEKGYLISFEGGEGAGKSTQAKLLYDKLKSKGYKVVLTKEPGGTEIGNKIRKLLLDLDNKKMSAWTEILLYTADRAQDIVENIKPAYKDGKIVLVDRYIDSNIIYQGFGRKIDIDKIKKINKWVVKNIYPDLTILLDIEVDKGLKRARAISNSNDRLEEEIIEFHQSIRKGYLKLAQKEDRVKKFNADQVPGELQQKIWETVKTSLLSA